jgi:hypothetical protein
MRAANERFVDLGLPRRVWAVAAIHGDKDRLMALHDHIATRFNVRDRLVYLGNYLGVGSPDNEAIIEELLAFRAALLAKPGMETTDIVHLRGPAEESWQRLLRLQFAPVPAQALEKLLAAGVEPYLRLYGVSLNDTRSFARAGSVAITRWTNQLRLAQRLAPGHEALMCSMRRAAVTQSSESGAQRMLFVPAGFNSSRSLEDQGDTLWFHTSSFRVSCRGASPFARIVRGFDPNRDGVDTDDLAVTLDGGCGFGGPLVCGCFNAAGHLLEIVAVGGPSAIDAETASDEDHSSSHAFDTSDAFRDRTSEMAVSA